LLPGRQNVTVEIFDVSGNVVYHEELTQVLSHSMALDLNNRAGGVYFLRVKMKDQVITRKMLLKNDGLHCNFETAYMEL
jgi:hypothetical protein